MQTIQSSQNHLDSVVKAIARRVLVRRAPNNAVYFNGLPPEEAIVRLVPKAAALSPQGMNQLVSRVKRELGLERVTPIQVPDWQLAA